MPKAPKNPRPTVAAEPKIPEHLKAKEARGHIQAPVENVSEQLMPDLKRLVQLREDKDRLAKEETRINIEIDQLQQVLTAKFDQVGIRNMKVAGLGTFYRTVSAMPKVEDEAAMFKDLEKRGQGAIIKQTVHYQTLRALCNELAEAGEKPLAGVDIFEKQAVAFRRG